MVQVGRSGYWHAGRNCGHDAMKTHGTSGLVLVQSLDQSLCSCKRLDSSYFQAVALPAAYVALGWCLCLLAGLPCWVCAVCFLDVREPCLPAIKAVLVHRLLSGSVNGSWCAQRPQSLKGKAGDYIRQSATDCARFGSVRHFLATQRSKHC